VAVRAEDCETLTMDLRRANTRLSEIDEHMATVAEKVRRLPRLELGSNS